MIIHRETINSEWIIPIRMY